MDERQAQRIEADKRRQIELGLRLELLEMIPEGVGEKLISELKEALQSKDKEMTLSVLKKIGDTMHAFWGNSNPTKPVYEEGEEKYKLHLSTGTAGTRLFINTKSFDKFPGDLIFPNVNLDHKNNDRTLAEVFEELFGKSAENIQPDGEKPYYRIKISSEEENK